MKKLLINPFLKIAGLQALSLGIFFMIIGASLAGLFNARFDGALDLHFGESVPFIQPFIDQLICLATLTIVFYLFAIILGVKPRFIDIAGTMALARVPYTITPLTNIAGLEYNLGNKLINIDPKHVVWPLNIQDSILFFTLTIISLVFIVWLVALYFNAWKTCTNLKGNKLVLSFIAGLLIVEIITIYLTRNFI